MKARPILAAALLLTASSVRAEEPPNPARVSLVSEVTSIAPSEPFYVALHVRMPKGYHTYWLGHGIVGIPTGIDWTLPEGFTADPILWPIPKRVDMVGINAHGYQGEVLLMMRITPPSRLEASRVTLSGEATWMCCEKTCHPGYEKLEITLPVSGKPQLDKTWAERFAKTRTLFPKATKAWTAQVGEVGAEEVRLLLQPGEGARHDPGAIYFYSADNHIHSDLPQQVVRKADSSLLLILPRSEFGPKKPSFLPGLLEAEHGWEKGAPDLKHIWIEPELPAPAR